MAKYFQGLSKARQDPKSLTFQKHLKFGILHPTSRSCIPVFYSDILDISCKWCSFQLLTCGWQKAVSCIPGKWFSKLFFFFFTHTMVGEKKKRCNILRKLAASLGSSSLIFGWSYGCKGVRIKLQVVLLLLYTIQSV